MTTNNPHITVPDGGLTDINTYSFTECGHAGHTDDGLPYHDCSERPRTAIRIRIKNPNGVLEMRSAACNDHLDEIYAEAMGLHAMATEHSLSCKVTVHFLKENGRLMVPVTS